MPTSAQRSKLLMVMLISLGIAAASAVIALLVPGRNVVGEVILMAILTAVGCALVMVAARFLDKHEHRLAAQATIALIIVEYLLCLMLSWDEATRFLRPRGEDALAETALFIAFAGLPAIVMCRLLRTTSGRLAAHFGLGLLTAAALVMVCGALAPGLSYQESENINIYGAWVELFSFPIVACLVGIQTDPSRRWFRWIGIISAAVGLVSLLCAFIIYKEFEPGLIFAVSAALALFVGHFNLAIRAPLSPGMAWLRWLTIGTVAGLCGVIILPFLIPRIEGSDDDLYNRLIAAAAICAGCGSAAMTIVALMNRKKEREMTAPADLREIQLQCPSCQTKQTVPLGDSACRECGLKFLIKVDEPRCETCGYLLYRLKSDRCPECGTLVQSPAVAGMKSEAALS